MGVGSDGRPGLVRAGARQDDVGLTDRAITRDPAVLDVVVADPELVLEHHQIFVGVVFVAHRGQHAALGATRREQVPGDMIPRCVEPPALDVPFRRCAEPVLPNHQVLVAEGVVGNVRLGLAVAGGLDDELAPKRSIARHDPAHDIAIGVSVIVLPHHQVLVIA